MDCVHAEDVHDTHATSCRGGLLQGREMWHHHLPCLQTVDATWKVQVHQKYLRLLDYSISAAAKAREKLWKARDAIIAVRD
eukprot:7916781-Ditylum_brightwellii.AAC.1